MANFSVKGLFIGLLVFFVVGKVLQVVLFLFLAYVISSDFISSDFIQTISDTGYVVAIILGILTYRHFKKGETATHNTQQADQK
jgi:hypothetical protein